MPRRRGAGGAWLLTAACAARGCAAFAETLSVPALPGMRRKLNIACRAGREFCRARGVAASRARQPAPLRRRRGLFSTTKKPCPVLDGRHRCGVAAACSRRLENRVSAVRSRRLGTVAASPRLVLIDGSGTIPMFVGIQMRCELLTIGSWSTHRARTPLVLTRKQRLLSRVADFLRLVLTCSNWAKETTLWSFTLREVAAEHCRRKS